MLRDLPVLGRRRQFKLRSKAVINSNGLTVAQFESTRAHDHVALLQAGLNRRKITQTLAHAHKLLAYNLAAGFRAVIRCVLDDKNRIAVRGVQHGCCGYGKNILLLGQHNG